MDIEKQDYIRVLPDCERLLVKGGLLVADNVGFKDADAFNRAISDNPAWRSIALFSFFPFIHPKMTPWGWRFASEQAGHDPDNNYHRVYTGLVKIMLSFALLL
jgi:hypothetical protein